MNSRTVTEETRMNREIQTVGAAIIVQTAIRYVAYIGIAWLVLSFADRWVMAWLAGQ